MTGLIYLLLQNPPTLALLQAEVRHQAAASPGLTFETLATLKYLNACRSPGRSPCHLSCNQTYKVLSTPNKLCLGIQEALRFYPPVPLGISRILSHNNDGGQTVCGEWLPSGTRVSVHQYAAGHTTANFRDPERFAPERWLGDRPYEADKREARQPFSFGPRSCLAQSMAYHEMRLVIGTLVAKFDWELGTESQGWGHNRTAHVLWDKVPLMVRFTAVHEQTKRRL